MSTTGNQRMTRAASRAASDGRAPSVAPSVAGSIQGRSRRNASPAKSQLGEKPVGNKKNRAYGTEPDQTFAQRMSVQQGMTEAINPIANAVSQAENARSPEMAQNQPEPSPSRLPMVEEEDQGNVRENGFRNPAIEHSTAHPSFFSLRFWGPRRGPFGEEDNVAVRNARRDDMTANDRIQQYYRENVRANQPLVMVSKMNQWTVWRIFIVFMAFMLCLLSYDIYRGPVFGSKYDFFQNRKSLGERLPTGTPKGYGHLKHRIDKIEEQLQDLQVASHVPYIEAPKHQVNWFSPGLGAFVDGYLSSPVASKCVSPHVTIPAGGWSKGLLPSWLFEYLNPSMCGSMIPFSGTQAEALLPWQDVHEKFCAPSGRGKLQLTVMPPRVISPTELVVEHLHKDATFEVGNAPKEVELWIEVQDDDVRAIVSDAIGKMYPEFWQTSSPQRDKELHEAQALPQDFVPVGRWIYNIYQRDHIQTFKVPIPLIEYGVATGAIAVRVNSNWGDVGPTCLYRLRLHGYDQSGLTEYLEEDPAKVAKAKEGRLFT